MPGDGLIFRDAVLLRLRALPARARGEAEYRRLATQYRDLAAQHGYEGHLQMADELLAG